MAGKYGTVNGVLMKTFAYYAANGTELLHADLVDTAGRVDEVTPTDSLSSAVTRRHLPMHYMRLIFVPSHVPLHRSSRL
jgi:hypothetical protein